MGCDIHCWAQVRGEDGVWREALSDVYDGRNYRLFSMLADVRNGDPKTGDNYCMPIREPRGIPDDSPSIQREADGWGHSGSWLTLAELQSFNWTGARVVLSGVVNPAQYAKWKVDGAPDGWCGGAFGGRTRHVTNEEMDALIADGTASATEDGHFLTARDGNSYYTRVHWTQSYAEVAGSFVTDTMPKLAALGSPGNVRIVFFFDN